MNKFFGFALYISGALLVNSCGVSVSSSDATMSSTKGREMGSLSGDEDLQTLLTSNKFNHILIDLDKYRYDRSSSKKDYQIDMTFTKKRVEGLADCNRFSANYRAKDGELTFSRVHMEPANDLSSCKGFIDADEAINAFLNDSYTLLKANDAKIILESDTIDTQVTISK